METRLKLAELHGVTTTTDVTAHAHRHFEQPASTIIDTATRALGDIGHLRDAASGPHSELFAAMMRYERATGRQLFKDAMSFEDAAQRLVRDIEHRNCSVPDTLTQTWKGLNLRAWGPDGGLRTRGNLSWSVMFPSDTNASQAAGIANTLSNAFARWAAASNNFFSFRQVAQNGDLQIQFGDQNLATGFGRVGGKTGQADYPPGNRILFDIVDFPPGSFTGTNVNPALLSIALHEIGHALGLSHSTNPNSVMYPYDINAGAIDAESTAAIRALYNWAPLARYPDDRSSSDGPTFATTSTVSLAASFDRMWMAWRGSGTDSNLWMSSSPDGVNWTPQEPLGERSTHGPALAAIPVGVTGAVVYLAWKGEADDRRLYWTRSTNLKDFEPHRRLDDRLSTTRPALAAFNGRIVMAWKASDDERIYWSSFDGSNWTPQEAILGRTTSHAPALAAFGNRLFMFWKGSGNDTRIFQATLGSEPNAIWSAGEEVSYQRIQTQGVIRDVVNTDSHPAAVQRGDTLVLSYRGMPGDTAVWFMTLRQGEGQWSGPFTVPGAGTTTGPGIAQLGGALFIAWKALEPQSELHFSRLG